MWFIVKDFKVFWVLVNVLVSFMILGIRVNNNECFVVNVSIIVLVLVIWLFMGVIGVVIFFFVIIVL